MDLSGNYNKINHALNIKVTLIANIIMEKHLMDARNIIYIFIIFLRFFQELILKAPENISFFNTLNEYYFNFFSIKKYFLF